MVLINITCHSSFQKDQADWVRAPSRHPAEDIWLDTSIAGWGSLKKRVLSAESKVFVDSRNRLTKRRVDELLMRMQSAVVSTLKMRHSIF
jgi:hypothetical protein